mmetsp:Transcript_46132/g.68729  ORF Transcript_46132/g.68729 Transcript_46132/m.68729 type:complete len:612 (-) Transcript_46132:873-2708(-)|eukprot:CAMPEP_0194026836 /NCGR_PEP_ID=MMETSP0009_2-20130614/1091_1 /TAXON_ID=210454 /ORGANISM="Grammatophora oceanica, Strain CCMP 410" /LENGTH=611 /DNA_ID=CAMNT_0038665703 /DNA_START=16 /DNA_END=1851 /DNA_ORIENTATION=-
MGVESKETLKCGVPNPSAGGEVENTESNTTGAIESASVSDLVDGGRQQEGQTATLETTIAMQEDNMHDISLSTTEKASGSVTTSPLTESEQTPGAFPMVGDNRVSRSQEEEGRVDESIETEQDYDNSRNEPQHVFDAQLVVDDGPSQKPEAASKGKNDTCHGARDDTTIENVVLDEMEAGMAATSPTGHETMLVDASPLKSKVSTTPMWQNRRLQLAVAATLVLIAIAVTLGVVFGIQQSGDDSDHDKGTEDPVVDTVGTTRMSFVQDVLPDYTQAALNDTLSDQSFALEWLWKDPNKTAALPLFRRIQRYALAVCFFASTERRTPELYESTAWMTDAHECSWPQNFAENVVCREDRLVILGLTENVAIRGTMAPEIGLLTDLVFLDFTRTAMRGSIPTQIGLLSDSLDRLLLGETKISGPIPSEIGNLAKLVSIRFARGSLISSIPTEIGRLGSLRIMEVHENELTGSIPTEIGKLSQHLELLSLHGNFITGSIPSEMGAATKLVGFANVATNMTGTVPTELGNLVNMREFFCNNTSLSGTIPTEMQLMTKLSALVLHDTQFTGTFPLCGLVESGSLTSYTVPCDRVECSCNCGCQNENVTSDNFSAEDE